VRGASNGMQVKPKGDQSMIPVVDTRDLFINQFTKGEESKIEDSNLNVKRYNSNWGTGSRDIGAAYN
jgi:hypothetical protein